MRLNKSTRDAIRILVDCARAGDTLIKVGDLSTRLEITPQNTFKIVHILSRAGFVAPMRGRRGGVRLARPASDIRIGEVVKALELSGTSDEEADEVIASGSGSGVNRMFGEALEAFVTVLNQHSLADMAAGGISQGPEAETPQGRRRRASADVGAEPRRMSRPGTIVQDC
jgi:Rrf2 family protein